MTIERFIHEVHAFDKDVSSEQIEVFCEASLAALPEEDRALALSVAVDVLSSREWTRALAMGSRAFKKTGRLQDDEVDILQSLVLFKPEGEPMPQVLLDELSAIPTVDLGEIARHADRCYRIKCMQLLLLVRARASDEELHRALMELERASWHISPVNEVLIAAIAALHGRVHVLNSFEPFLQWVLDLSNVSYEKPRTTTEKLVRQFQHKDITACLNLPGEEH